MYYTDIEQHPLVGGVPGTPNCWPGIKDCQEKYLEYLNYFSWPILSQNIVSVVNFFVQVIAIWMVYTEKKFQKGSFFIFLVVLALSVIFRTFTSLASNIIASSVPNNSVTYKISLDVSLYVDYCSGYFSMVLIFFMFLNRCLCFVKRQWSDTIFEGKRILAPIFVSLVLSVLSAMACITTSGISRSYDSSVGFVDVGAPEGLKNLITRLYHLFPIGSVICYIVLFSHLRLKKLQKTKNQNNKGEQKVFIQLLVTIVFYGIMAILTELLVIIQLDFFLQTALIAILNCVNFLPEITLPFLLICSNLKPKRRVSVFVATSRTQSQTKMPAKV